MRRSILAALATQRRSRLRGLNHLCICASLVPRAIISVDSSGLTSSLALLVEVAGARALISRPRMRSSTNDILSYMKPQSMQISVGRLGGGIPKLTHYSTMPHPNQLTNHLKTNTNPRRGSKPSKTFRSLPGATVILLEVCLTTVVR